MISAGIDSGSTTTKVVLLEGRTVRASVVVPTSELPARSAREAYEAALRQAGLRAEQVTVAATTGYGRRQIGFGDLVVTEIKACAAGVLLGGGRAGEVHTIIDVGGQDTKVIALDDSGDIEDFSMNDKCAAGTGRFLEMLAQKLGLTYPQCAAEAMRSERMIQMNATCAVFAESEVVGLLARGASKADIAAAAHHAIASRIRSMVKRVGQRGTYWFVGGGALNEALVQAVEDTLNEPVHVPADAQLVVALGASAAAAERFEKRTRQETHEGLEPQ